MGGAKSFREKPRLLYGIRITKEKKKGGRRRRGRRRRGKKKINSYEALLEDVPFSLPHPSRSLRLLLTYPDGSDWTKSLGSALPPFFFSSSSSYTYTQTGEEGIREGIESAVGIYPNGNGHRFSSSFFSHYIHSSPSGVFVC